MNNSTCPVVEDGVVCGQPVRSRGWCSKHYERVLAHGDPLLGRQGEFSREAKDYFLLFAMTPTVGCRRWPFHHSTGYPWLSHEGEGLHVHVLTCEAWHGPRPEGLEAAHSCGNRWCWAGEHLRWATHRENERDKVAHGATNRGSRHGNSKLTEADVLEIRRRHAAGQSQTSIASEFGINPHTVSLIVRRKRWAWLEG